MPMFSWPPIPQGLREMPTHGENIVTAEPDALRDDHPGAEGFRGDLRG